MKLSNLFIGALLLDLVLHNIGANEEKNRSKLQITSNTKIWEGVCKYLTQIMANSDLPDRNVINVGVLLMTYSRQNFYYDGFYETFIKFSSERMKIINGNLWWSKYYNKPDFQILLITNQASVFNTAFWERLIYLFPNKSTKFIFLFRSWNNYLEHMSDLEAYFGNLDYINIYEILVDGKGNIFVYRSTVPQNGKVGLVKIMSHKNATYLTARDILKPHQIQNIRIKLIFCEMLPFSYLDENNDIVGADGILIKELTKKLNTTSYVINSHNVYPKNMQIFQQIQTAGDILLCSRIAIYSIHVDGVSLYETDGLCVLAPRNIRVSGYENALPFDLSSLLMIILSMILVTLCWKIFCNFDKNELSLWDIFVNVCLLTLNEGVDGIEGASKKVKILIYSFLFGSFVMISLYESAILSFMLTESSLRAARDIKELNDSNTKFYNFYTLQTALSKNLPIIKDELVMNYFEIAKTGERIIPSDLYANLAYLVSCSYAEFFLQSTKNFRGNQQLFDQITLATSYPRYAVRSGFMFTNDFAKMVEIFTESGIRDHLLRETVNKDQVNMKLYKKAPRDYIEFEDMAFPVILLAIGCLISSLTFVIEVVYDRLMKYYLIKKDMSTLNGARKLKIKKWRKKYLRKCSQKWKLAYLGANTDAAYIKTKRTCMALDAQSVNDVKMHGGYLTFGRFKVDRKRREIRGTVIKFIRKG